MAKPWRLTKRYCDHFRTVATERYEYCADCGATLSVGPSNDDIPLDEIAHAVFAKDDGYWLLFEDPDAFDWDVTRTLAEQRPYEQILTDDEAAAIIAQSSDSYEPFIGAGAYAFAPSDTASREPWHTTQETQESGDLETRLRAAADEVLDGIGNAAPDGVA